MTALFLIFEEFPYCFFIVAAPIYKPINSARGFHFLCTLGSTCYLLFFWKQPFWHVWGIISLQFWYVFSGCLMMLSISSCVCQPSVCFLWKNFYSGPLPIFKIGSFFSPRCWIIWVICIFFVNLLSDIAFINVFFHFIGFLFSLLIIPWLRKSLLVCCSPIYLLLLLFLLPREYKSRK